MSLWSKHAIFEKNSIILVLGIVTVIAIGGVVEIAPLFYLKSTIEKVDGVRPYTPLELAGRNIYVREGCYNCHSQMIRALRDEVERYGHYSLAAESMYDRPFQWGSKRTGPDLARIGGKSVGIVANQPNYLGGILDVDSADKAAHFIQICDAFNVPLVFLQDVPGFMVGSKVEHAGIIRHGAKMLHVMSAATVPKITVIVRKAYGAGYYAMSGRAYEPDLIVSWPTGEISVMGAEGMVGIAARKLFGGQEPPPEMKKQIVEQIQKNIDIYKVAGWGLVDDVIDPRDTRRAIAWGLEVSSRKRLERPERKRGVIPV